MPTNKDAIGVRFKVLGGVNGECAQEIKKTLTEIAKAVPLKISIDKTDFSKQLDALKKELDQKLGNVKIKINTAETATNGTSSASAEQSNYETLRAQLDKIYQTKLKISSLPNDSLKYVQGNAQLAEQNRKYTERLKLAAQNRDVSAAEFQQLLLYRQELERVLQIEIDRGSIASQTSQAKIANKAQSLYTDNGFDKILARSKEATKIADDFNAKVQAVLNQPGGATNQQIKDLNAEFINCQTQIKKIGAETDTVGNKLKEAFASKMIQTLAYALIGIMTRALRQVYQNVKDLDKAITDLQIATGKTREETAQLVKQYAVLAKQLGATVTEVTSAADTWLRQGYSIAETNTLIKNTLMLSKLGQLESAEAAKALTSAMKGYKVEVEDSVDIVDKFTAVDMEAAVSAGDIATAMAETAASADIAGVSMDKLIGYIATVSEVTQDGAESVGTFYKTLFARMGNVKAGKFVDDETGESLNDVEKVLGNVGIALRGNNGEFLDFGNVLDSVAAKWDSFNNVQQHAIATAFAGTRQQEKFIVLMENYGAALEYAGTAATSSGTAQSKYTEAVMEGMEAHLNSLTASWQEFSQNLLDSDLAIFFADLLRGIVDVLNAIMSFGDGFAVKVALAAVAVVLAMKLIKGSLFDGIASFADFKAAVVLNAEAIGIALKKLISNPYTYIALLIGLFSSLSDNLNTAGQFIVAALMAIAAAVTICLATMNTQVYAFMASNPLGWILAIITVVVMAITALVKGLVSLSNASTQAMEEAVEAAKKSKEAWEEVCEQLEEVDEKIEETRDRIKELQILSNEGKITLVQQDELDKLDATLVALENEKALLESIAQAKKNTATKDASSAVDKILAEKLSDAYTQEDNTFWNGVGRVAASIFSLGFSDWIGGYGISDWSKPAGGTWGGDKHYTTAGDYVKDIFGNWEEATDQQRQYAMDFYSRLSEQKEMLSYYTGENLEDWQKEANDAYNTYYEYTHRFLLANNDAASVWKSVLTMERFPDIKEFLTDFANAGDVTAESVRELYDNNPVFKDMIDYLISLGMFTWDDTEKVSGLVNQINALADSAQVLTRKGFLDILSEIEEKFDALSSVLEDIEEDGIAAANSIRTLLEDYPSLEKYFQMTPQGYKLADAYSGWSMSEVLQDFTTNYLQPYVDALANCEEGTENYTIAQENLNNAIAVCATLLRSSAISEATSDLKKEQEALEKQLDAYKGLVDIRKDLLKTYKEELKYQKDLEKKQKNIASLQTQLALSRMDGSAAGRARTRELEKELQDARDELDEFTLEHAIEVLTEEIENGYDEYEKFINTQVDRLEEAINNISKNITVDVTLPSATQPPETTTSTTTTPQRWTSYQDAADAGFGNIAGASASERGRVTGWVNPNTGENYKSYQEYLDVMYEKYMGKAPVYHDGGFVGGRTSLKSNEEFAKLMNEEYVSTPSQITRFIRETMPRIAQAITQGEVHYNAPLINIKCDSVTKDSIVPLEQIVNKAVKELKKQIDSAFSRTGYKKEVK